MICNALIILVHLNASDFEDDGEDESDGGWQQELQRRYAQDANFMAEVRARQPTSPPDQLSYNRPFNPISQSYQPAYHPNFNQAEPSQDPFGPPQVGFCPYR